MCSIRYINKTQTKSCRQADWFVRMLHIYIVQRKVDKSIPVYENKSVTTGKLFTTHGEHIIRFQDIPNDDNVEQCKNVSAYQKQIKRRLHKQYAVIQKMMKTKMIRSTYQTYVVMLSNMLMTTPMMRRQSMIVILTRRIQMMI